MFMRLSLSRRALRTSAVLLLLGGALSVYAPMAHAQFLVGAGLYSSQSDGTANAGYFYSTATAGGVLPLLLTPNNGNNTGKDVAIPLSAGTNSFTFNNNASVNPGGFAGLELFFDTTATPYDPASPTARTPDLVVFAPTTSTTTFATPTAGTLVESYDFSGAIAANGLSTFLLDGTPISITSFSSSTSPDGSFTVLVGSAPSSTPEPGTMALLVGMSITGASFVVRRKRRK